MEFWILIALLFNIVNFLLIGKIFKIFTEITDNHNDLLYLLRDEINRLKDDGK